MKDANCLQEFVTKCVQMSIVCTDTCLEMLSALVNSSVNDAYPIGNPTIPHVQGCSQKFILGGYNFYCTILQSYIY